jgi:vacuolar-type H+-ATPase subunit H
VDKHSADTKAAHKGAHAHTAHAEDEFLSSVKTLKEAEKSSAAAVEEAKKEAARIEAHGREKAIEIISRANEKAVAAKNEILLAGREKTEKEVSELTHDAKKLSEKIRGKRLSDKDVSALSEGVI